MIDLIMVVLSETMVSVVEDDVLVPAAAAAVAVAVAVAVDVV